MSFEPLLATEESALWTVGCRGPVATTVASPATVQPRGSLCHPVPTLLCAWVVSFLLPASSLQLHHGAEPHVTAWVLALILGTPCLTNDPSSIPGPHPEPPSLLSPDPGGHGQAWGPRSEHVEVEEIKKRKKKKKSAVRTSKVDEGDKTPWLLSPSLPVVGGSQRRHVHRSHRHGPQQYTPPLTAQGPLQQP